MVSRRDFGRSAVASALGAGGAGAAPGPGKGLRAEFGGPSPASGELVLFPFDDFSVPLRYRLKVGLVNRANPFRLHPRVLEKGKPGDPDSYDTAFNGAVLQIGDELRMWYLGTDRRGKWRVCYATSKDGLKWEKPALGLVEFNGSKQNNLVAFDRDDAATVTMLYEPGDPDPGRRFKMIYEVSPFHIGAAFSADGLTWKQPANNPILKHNNIEPGGLIKYNGCYYLNGQGGNVGTKRALVTFLSYDFEHWTDAVAVGLRRDTPPHADIPGPHAGEQIHLGAGVWDRGNVIIGIYGQWHGPSNDRHFVSIDLGLAVSNDALHYREPIPDFQIVSGYEIFRQVHHPEAVPAPALNAGQAFANVGNQTFFWYSPWYGGSVCVATWPRDRLGYFEVVTKPKPNVYTMEDTHSLNWRQEIKFGPVMTNPHFISCPLRLGESKPRVFVNAEGLSEQSHLTVEVLDERMAPVPGYTGSDSIPLTQPGLRRPVAWRDRQALPKFDQPVRLKVTWRGARPEDAFVYAVYVVGTGD
ncbi:MAG: hypothetical protein ACKV22_19965 [Bryobacteraceae bacterium]